MSENEACRLHGNAVDDGQYPVGAATQSLPWASSKCSLLAAALALVALGEAPFEVVSDMRMPGMDGAAFLAQVRALARQRAHPAHQPGRPALVDRGSHQGGHLRYLCKPCPNEVLIEPSTEAGHPAPTQAPRNVARNHPERHQKTFEVPAMVAPWASSAPV